MYGGLIARRYAKALFEYSSQIGDTDNAYNGILILKQLCSDASFMEYLSLPVVRYSEKAEKITAMLAEKGNCSNSLSRFISLVMKNGRENHLIEIINAFSFIYKEDRKILDVTLITAAEPDPAVSEGMKALIENKTGYDVNIFNECQPDIIGGFILRHEGYQLDVSVKRALKRIEKAFERKNNRIV